MPRPGFVLEVDRSTPSIMFWRGENFSLEKLPAGRSRVIYPPEPLEAISDIDGAIRELSAARDQRPEYMAARVQLGLAYFSAGRKDEAVATWRDVLTRDPGNKNAALYLRMMKE